MRRDRIGFVLRNVVSLDYFVTGVYEIGYAIEDPFQGSLRLSILCDTIRRDVLGSQLRQTAFELEEDGDKINDDEFDEDDTFSRPKAGSNSIARPNGNGGSGVNPWVAAKPPVWLSRFQEQTQGPDGYQMVR